MAFEQRLSRLIFERLSGGAFMRLPLGEMNELKERSGAERLARACGASKRLYWDASGARYCDRRMDHRRVPLGGRNSLILPKFPGAKRV